MTAHATNASPTIGGRATMFEGVLYEKAQIPKIRGSCADQEREGAEGTDPSP